MKKYLIYIFPLIVIIIIIFYFLSSSEITVNIKNPESFVIANFLGDLSLKRNEQEIAIKRVPFVLFPKDELETKHFSGLTLLCKDSTILICYPSTSILIGDDFINLNKGSIEWRRGKNGIKINFGNGITLQPSGTGVIEVDKKLSILSLRGESRLIIDGKEKKIEELRKVIIDGKKLTVEMIKKPPVLLSPRNNEVYGDWLKDFGTLNISIKASEEYNQFQFEVSPDPYFLSTIFSIFLKDKSSQVSLEKIGTGKRFARVIPFKDGVQGFPSETVKFFVRAFPFSKVSEKGIPPTIDIYSVIVSGNIVIVKGKVDRGCRLFVNKEEVRPEPNGEFNVPVTFNALGERWVEIEAISPNGLRSSKRQRVFIVGY